MKKMLAIILILALALPVVSSADLPDLSGLSFEELVQLRDQINLAMWNSQEWQEVTVPAGIYQIGVDIPAGHWTIKALPNMMPEYVIYASALSENRRDVDIMAGYYIMEAVCGVNSEYNTGDYKTEVDIVMEDGFYLRLDGTMIFTPYTGKPDLGFK